MSEGTFRGVNAARHGSLRSRDDARHPFSRIVNPALGSRLEGLSMDRTFVRGRGCEIFDTDGRPYLDFMAGYGALPLGYNPPAIWRALRSIETSLEPS